MATTDTQDIISPTGIEYLRLHLVPGVGSITLRRLLDYFGSPAAVFDASRAELQNVDGVGQATAEAIFTARNSNALAVEIERAGEIGAHIRCIEDAGYPASLRAIPDPPTCIYVRGRLQPEDAVAVAMVGTRRCSHYGREQAMRFGQLLAGAGFTVVSGLARGIDGHAHRGALQAGGRTIAVMGCGLGSTYPIDHTELADAIADGNGALISEFPIDLAPAAGNFPMRNRIITGLALGVLVVEAGKRSGALITARLASEYNREVFALPGRVDHPDLTAGVHGLIRDGGAKLVTCLEDILDELGDVGRIMNPESESTTDASGASQSADPTASRASTPTHRLDEKERAVFTAVGNGCEDAEAIADETAIHIGRVTAILTALQIKGLITCLPGNRFVPRRRS